MWSHQPLPSLVFPLEQKLPWPLWLPWKHVGLSGIKMAAVWKGELGGGETPDMRLGRRELEKEGRQGNCLPLPKVAFEAY